MKKTVVHFWVLYPLKSAPSQRFRVEQYLPALHDASVEFRIFRFYNKSTWNFLYTEGHYLAKFAGVIWGFCRRIRHLFLSVKADYVFLLREATPAGPPVFEWLLSKIFRRKIIYDFDDAIWIPGGEKTTWVKRWIKETWKIKYIIRWAFKVSAGNDFLCNYARQYNSSVILLPTVIDTKRSHNLLRDQSKNDKIVVGWTGSHSTLHNLDEIKDLIPELKKEIDFDFLVISNKKPGWDFDFIFKKWEAESELEDLLKMHIGVMPLKKGPWFEGKCGFKLIQYLACGIPAVASPVGVNPQIAVHNRTGFIANNREEWKDFLIQLIRDEQLRIQMGRAGRDHIEKNYSLHSHSLFFLSLFP